MILENLLEILTKRRSQAFKKVYRYPLYATNAVGESISSATMWNIMSRLGKHDFSLVSVVNNLKDGKLFSDQMNRNHFDPNFTKRDWNCSIM